MTSVPGGTDTGTPSMIRLIMPSAIRPPSPVALARQIGLKLAPEFLDAADDGRRARVRQYADRLAGHVLGEIEQEIQIVRLSLPREDPLEDLGRPGCAFAALRALRARLVRVEPGEPHDLIDH